MPVLSLGVLASTGTTSGSEAYTHEYVIVMLQQCTKGGWSSSRVRVDPEAASSDLGRIGPAAHVMTRRSNIVRIGLAAACLVVLIASVAIMAATPAGTTISTTATAQYKSSSGTQMPTATSNTVTVTVTQPTTASVSVSPASATKTADSSLSASYGITITNTGSGSDTFDLTTAAKSGSTATIYQDANGDGIRQSTETTTMSATSSLAAGASAKCVVVVTLSSSVTTDTITFTAKSRADATKTAQSVLTINKASGNTYIQSWLINGYYPNTTLSTQMTMDYLGGEASVAPTESSTSGGKVWKRLDSTTPYVNIWTFFGKPTYCVGYAFTYVYVPTAQTVTMLTGSDDGIKVWLNGTVVLTKDVQRGYVADSDSAQIDLPAGWSRMLVKITQKDWDWGFSLRLLDASGNAVQGLQTALAPGSSGGTTDTTPPVISNIKTTPGSTSATVEWDTDEASTTLVNYGTTTSLGTNSTSSTMATHHTASLTGLTPGTAYYLKVGSVDSAGNTAWSSQVTFQTSSSTTAASYIQTWLINGYYPNSTLSTQMTTDYLGGEANVSPYAGSTSGGKTWAKLASSSSYVNLWAYYGKPTYCVGYAFTYVYSPSDQTVTIKTGSDDGIKVWLNGTAVLTKDVQRGYTADSDTATMNLNAGWNKLLVKITQKDWDWGFSLKICDSSGNAVPGVTWDVVPPTTGVAPIISNIKTTPSTTSATIEWDTDEASTTMVDYGPTSSLGASYTDSTLVMHHKATITGLSTGSMYWAKIGSTDSSGTASWIAPFRFPTTTGSAYVQMWLVNGYYPNSTLSTQMSTDYLGGEADAYPAEGSTSGGKSWLKLASTTPYVNIWTFYNKPTYCVGYAFTRVYTPNAQTVTLKTGSDDGIEVWLNGTVVETVDTWRGYTADSDVATMNLSAGWNRLLVKITQKDWDWGFSLKICDSAGNIVPGVAYTVVQ